MVLLPKRRWLRFSVRTLLIAVTIFCVWLGWQVHIVRERSNLRQRFADRVIFLGTGSGRVWGSTGVTPSLSLVREAMGDRAVETIQLPRLDFALRGLEPSDVDSLRRAFPEAAVITGGIPLVR